MVQCMPYHCIQMTEIPVIYQSSNKLQKNLCFPRRQIVYSSCLERTHVLLTYDLFRDCLAWLNHISIRKTSHGQKTGNELSNWVFGLTLQISQNSTWNLHIKYGSSTFKILQPLSNSSNGIYKWLKAWLIVSNKFFSSIILNSNKLRLWCRHFIHLHVTAAWCIQCISIQAFVRIRKLYFEYYSDYGIIPCTGCL